MCGICGVISKGDYRVDVARISTMVQSLKHRGPDDNGIHLTNGVALGHTRLSIIDLASGRQPIYNEDGQKCIVFNGEIYNYLDLREYLIGRGHRFSSRSDTEVILHLYEEEGTDCVKDLRGMFAFAIWDGEERSLFLARDRLGIKPVYYSENNECFSFSSEIKSLLVAGLVRPELNVPLVDQYIALNYTIGPETMIEKVKKLMPGHYLIFKGNSLRVSKYWDMDEIEVTRASFDECLEIMGSLIEESIRIRLMSEVPLGAFLSGGVDSSVTVGVMARITGKPVKTFTVGYENAEDASELQYARIVADHFKTEHHEMILKPGRFMDLVTNVVWYLDEPVAEYATIPLFLLSRLAKEHVTVMLSGEGADELFAGYPIYRYMNYIESYRRLPAFLRRGLIEPIIDPYFKVKKHGKYRDWLKEPLERRYIGNGSNFSSGMRDRLYTADFQKDLDRSGLYNVIASYYDRVSSRDSIGRMLYLDTKTWLPEDLLIKADKMTMAAAIELRVPFLDHKLVEFAASLPSKMKDTGFTSKYIFKKYAEKFVPGGIVHRKKRGFPVPVKQWLRRELFENARQILLESRTRERGIFDLDYVEELLAGHAHTSMDLSKQLWNLFILEIWLRIYIDGDYRWNQG